MNALTREFSRCSLPFFPLLLTPGKLSKKLFLCSDSCKRTWLVQPGLGTTRGPISVHSTHLWDGQGTRWPWSPLPRGPAAHPRLLCRGLALTSIFSSPVGKPIGDWFITRKGLVNRDAEKRELLEASGCLLGGPMPLLCSFSGIHLGLVFPLWLHMEPVAVHQNTAYSTVAAC